MLEQFKEYEIETACANLILGGQKKETIESESEGGIE